MESFPSYRKTHARLSDRLPMQSSVFPGTTGSCWASQAPVAAASARQSRPQPGQQCRGLQYRGRLVPIFGLVLAIDLRHDTCFPSCGHHRRLRWASDYFLLGLPSRDFGRPRAQLPSSQSCWWRLGPPVGRPSTPTTIQAWPALFCNRRRFGGRASLSLLGKCWYFPEEQAHDSSR